MMQAKSPGTLAWLERSAVIGTRILALLGLIALMVVALITLANGMMRWLADQPIAGVVDVGALAIAIAVSCCLPASMMERSHITFRLASSISPTLGSLLDVLADVAVLLVLGLMAWQFWIYAGELLLTGERTFVLKIPAAPFWYVVSVVLWIATSVQCIVAILDLACVFGAARPAKRAEH